MTSPFTDVSPDAIARAMQPWLEFGHGLLTDASRNWGRYLLLTMPEPWEAAQPMLARQPHHLHCVASMDREEVERVEANLPPADTVVGLGGGTALDMAKYVAWRRGLEPVLVPSIASVDACVTNTIAVRDEGRVRYIGFVVPQAVLADLDLMRNAPPRLNRAGVGDILSIHTALWDWKAAANRGLLAYDEGIARQAAALIHQLEARAEGVRTVTEGALRWLLQAYAAENALCLQVGHSRPEEGSEHFFAYNVEHHTGRGYVHGELVSLGVLLMSRLQGNKPARVEQILNATGVRCQPRDLDLSLAEVKAALLTLPAYVESEKLPYSVINARTLDSASVRDICREGMFDHQGTMERASVE
ncbi:MAG: iron-containing alcohol dehydrogenase [Anaerolineae bacterium]|nr:MAG: iron-containing alcohol dehydrogenase [Anaerolineae bacterium]